MDEKFNPRHQIEGGPRKRRGPLEFRFWRDYDVALPHAEGFVVLRVFAPVKRIHPDLRGLLLRKELRDDGRLVAVYRGDVDRDAVRLDDLDSHKLYEALVAAKHQLSVYQLRWDERGKRSAPSLTQRLDFPAALRQEVEAKIERLPTLAEEEAVVVAQEVAPFVTPVDPPSEDNPFIRILREKGLL